MRRASRSSRATQLGCQRDPAGPWGWRAALSSEPGKATHRPGAGHFPRGDEAVQGLFVQSKISVACSQRVELALPRPPRPQGGHARYEFWSQRKKEWPLLYFCATQVLTGSRFSSCSNERSHSVSGRICSKLRGALLPNSFEQLTWPLHQAGGHCSAQEAGGGRRCYLGSGGLRGGEAGGGGVMVRPRYFLLSLWSAHTLAPLNPTTPTSNCAGGHCSREGGHTCTCNTVKWLQSRLTFD